MLLAAVLSKNGMTIFLSLCLYMVRSCLELCLTVISLQCLQSLGNFCCFRDRILVLLMAQVFCYLFHVNYKDIWCIGGLGVLLRPSDLSACSNARKWESLSHGSLSFLLFSFCPNPVFACKTAQVCRRSIYYLFGLHVYVGTSVV